MYVPVYSHLSSHLSFWCSFKANNHSTSTYLLTYLPTYVPTYLPIYISRHLPYLSYLHELPLYLSICRSFHVSSHLSVSISIDESTHRFVYQFYTFRSLPSPICAFMYLTVRLYVNRSKIYAYRSAPRNQFVLHHI